MAKSKASHVEDLNGAPLSDMIHAVAVAIADGQFQLDRAALRAAEFMSGQALLRDPDAGQLLTRDGHVTRVPEIVDTRVYFGYSYDENGKRQANQLSMIELGFVPTFYQFVDTVIDIKLTMRVRKQSFDVKTSHEVWDTTSIAGEQTAGRARKLKQKTVLIATPVDALYASSYNFSAEMASKVSTKLVPVPPPPILGERIRILMEQERMANDQKARESATEKARSLEKFPLGGPEFNGTFYYEIGDAAFPGNLVKQAFSVEAWVFLPANETVARAGVAGVWRDDETTPKGWLLGVFDNTFGFALSSAAKPQATIIKARGTFAPGQWRHLAAVYDGLEMLLYVDGQLCNGSKEQSGDIVYPSDSRLVIGGYVRHDKTVPFSGRIDDVRIWNRALTVGEIKRHMQGRLQGSEPGLVCYWRLDSWKDDALPNQVKRVTQS